MLFSLVEIYFEYFMCILGLLVPIFAKAFGGQISVNSKPEPQPLLRGLILDLLWSIRSQDFRGHWGIKP